ncbi:uncharacterized protein EDB93DRAFT_1291165 [Suillus bovinus]|uniref:uncharacterized protein n=1 Tax=Suillus bovinus TaxID=48563 RepID=UPI001B85E90A|nr:uncharacterized protein EDB93DRAFT_1291165 [Suillus bovinus]KAG2143819.1 hypothetical protein EDB93DRAFT_1291165 [Suillus bovinus]
MSLSPQFMEGLWVRKSFSAAGHTLLVYDYLLTFREEFVYIWDSPWTVVKILFLFNRYGNLIGQTAIWLEEAGLLAHNSQEFCQGFSIFTTCFMFISTESVHILVLVRAWAIWGTRRGVMNILAWSYVGYIVMLLVGATFHLHAYHLHFEFLQAIHVCVTKMPICYFTEYVDVLFCVLTLAEEHPPSFILDTVLFVLTMRSLRKYSREFQQLYPSSLLHVLFRDATLFFIGCIWERQNSLYFLGKGFATPLLSVAGQRLVLNLRGLQTRSYATRDLSREMDRQLQAFAEAGLDDVEELEGVQEQGVVQCQDA